MEELENIEQEAPKKKTRKPKKKEVKLELKEEFVKIVELIENTVKERRSELNTSTCARLNRAKIDLQSIIRTLK